MPNHEENELLNDIFDLYDCRPLLPFVKIVFFLRALKEVYGYIPNEYLPLSYHEVRALIILGEVSAAYTAKQSYELKKQQAQRAVQQQSSAERTLDPSSPTGPAGGFLPPGTTVFRE